VALRPPGYSKGRQWTPEHRKAHWEATHNDDFREKSRQTALQILESSRRTGSATDTPIEQRLQDELRNTGIGFATQVRLLDRYLVDILLSQAPIVIEADGALHQLPGNAAKDATRDKALAAAGYTIYRFRGGEINRDAAGCIRRVIAECSLSAEAAPEFQVRTSFSGPDHPNWKGGPEEFICSNCDAPFKRHRAQVRGERMFCTSRCYGEWMTANPEISGRNSRIERDWSDLRTLYEARMSTKQLAAYYDCSQKAILSAMRRLGIPVRQQGGYRPRGGFYQTPD
jgi:very-short-patch-repair endonuclease